MELLKVSEAIEKVGYYRDIATAPYIAKMVDAEHKILIPADNELQIDIDSDEQYQLFQSQFSIFRREMEVVHPMKPIALTMWASRSGLPKRHILITLPIGVTNSERIALQAALGSDPIRELLSMMRYFKGYEHPTLFCERGDHNAT